VAGVCILHRVRIPLTFASVAVLAFVAWMSPAVAAAAPLKCTDVGANAGPNNTCQLQITDPGYTVDVSFPSDYPDQKPLFDFVKQTLDGYLNVAKAPDPRDMPYALEITSTGYTSAVPPRGTQSVVLKVYESVGGAHPQTFYKAFNWDQGLRKPITIDNLFRAGTQPFPVILPLVQADVQKQLGVTVSIPPADGLDPTNYQNFAITNDTLLFFFSQGEFLPGPAGSVQVTVPRSAVDSMIA
jgi:uncharacterized protein DUF3298